MTEPIIVYTDGASKGNQDPNNRFAGWGIWFGDGDPRNACGRVPFERQTNQQAEAYAAIKALEAVTGDLEIRTDSQYLIGGMSGNKRNANVDLFERLDVLIRNRKVIWTKVKGHSGDYGNDAADKLANEGCKLPLVSLKYWPLTARMEDKTFRAIRRADVADERVEWHYLFNNKNAWLEIGRIPDVIKYDFEELWNLHPETRGQVKIYGKVMDTPRWQQSYLQDYSFSGMTHPALPLPAEFSQFLRWANSLYDDTTFNQVLINWYGGGQDYIGAHSDDESQLVSGSPVASISLYEEEHTPRIFRITTKTGVPKKKHDVVMDNKMFVVMGGDFQKLYKHQVPKMGETKRKVGRRINITFREFRV